MVGCKKLWVVSDGFGWFAVLVVTVNEHVTRKACITYCTYSFDYLSSTGFNKINLMIMQLIEEHLIVWLLI